MKKEDHGNTLEISLAEPEDGGEYKCAISSAGDRKELKHFVRIRGRMLYNHNDGLPFFCQTVQNMADLII